MSLSEGTRLGPYEIIAPVGTGGMGEVYKAMDTRLGRTVAIKILPSVIAQDPDFRERFDREAKTISTLNHPNICALYDVGETLAGSDSVRYLVLEYLEGESVAARLARRSIPLPEALKIATELASALDTAHRHGIIHRDLKPGNVMLVRSAGSSPSAAAKLLDFGLAKVGSPAVRSVNLAEAPTATAPATPKPTLTAQGTILGTLQYMAPEQVEGLEADVRTDIFAFGALLYEMVTGRKAFEAKSQASLVGAILKEDPPPVSRSQPEVSPVLDYVVRTCLSKDPESRFQSAHDVLLQLRWIAESGTTNVSPAAPIRRHAVLWAGALVAAIALGGWAAWWLKPSRLAPSVTSRFEIRLPDPRTLRVYGDVRPTATLSPDGSELVFVGNGQLWRRSLNRLDAEPIRGTQENPIDPVFSPDAQWIAYFVESPSAATASGTLANPYIAKKIALSGGIPIELGRLAGVPFGAQWNEHVIMFGVDASGQSGIQSLPDTPGGTPRTLVSVDPRTELAVQPQLVADGKHIIFTVIPRGGVASDVAKIVVAPLDGGEPRELLRGSGAQLITRDLLAFIASDKIHVAAFDSTRLVIVGGAQPVIDGVQVSGSGESLFAVSRNGTLVYSPALPASEQQVLVWTDRQGNEQSVAVQPSGRGCYNVRLSPVNEDEIACSGSGDIWILDQQKGTTKKITFTPAGEYNPQWMPDGRRLLFDSSEGGRIQILRSAADGTGRMDVMVPSPAGYPETVSPDGKFLVYHTLAEIAMLAPLMSSGAVRPLMAGNGKLLNADISHDGRWIAYESNESGHFEVYVHTFPALDNERDQVSFTGGRYPLWSRDGRQLFFIDGDGTMSSAVIHPGPTFTHDRPVKLFKTDKYYANVARDYDVSSDGTRFLFVKNTTDSSRAIVVSNWIDEVRLRIGGND